MLSLSKQRKTQIICIFWVLLSVIYILSSLQYGDYLDRSSEKEILYSNMMEYMLRFGGEDCKIVSWLGERGIISIAQSVEKDHGVAVYYPLSFLCFVDEYNLAVSQTVWYVYTSILSLLGLMCLYLLCRRFCFSRFVSCMTVLLVYLNPRMYAEGHYNNKDMVLLALTFVIFYWGHRFVTNKHWSDCIIFAFLGGIISNTKIIGIWIFGAIGLFYLLCILYKKQFYMKNILRGVLCICIWGITYILLTPASWDSVILFVKYNLLNAINFSRWNNYILFQGRLIHAEYTGMPQKYLPIMIGVTTPIIILILICWGYCILFLSMVKKKGKVVFENDGYLVLLALIGIVPLAYAVISATSVYNGWRHFYFSYASMVVAASYGCNWMYKRVKKCRGEKWLCWGFIFYCVVLALGIKMNYPHEHSFYNVFAGNNVEKYYEMDYWELSIRQALEQIAEMENEMVEIGTLNMVTMWGVEGNWAMLSKDVKSRLHLVEDWKDAKYIIVNPAYALIYNEVEYEYMKQNYELFARQKSYGNVVYEIYMQ